MRRKIAIGGFLGVSVLLGACAAMSKPGPVGNRAVPQPAKPVDVEKYMGLWYEQFRYEAPFQKNMDLVTARYSLNTDGTVKVVNRGKSAVGAGKWKESVGKAKVVDAHTSAKLKVSFFGPFFGNYWVLDHGDQYDWSIVGEPSGRYLWVLTREKHPDDDTMAALEARVRGLGYDWSLVRPTRQ
ncbi:lipocalin family protein [Sphingobium sp. BHU LFT2]|uniref:lipocalin family protein n=1 Tax=Sphingobium sp. BHU LFT2 TaxID=2807634 RepID=UPI001BE8114B|nr:lipocalin family protein [Sphingobium sp. BHU LFT2]MBT2244999.1 lipocalin family protein [Sphingobium sp. BHU LFT2]